MVKATILGVVSKNLAGLGGGFAAEKKSAVNFVRAGIALRMVMMNGVAPAPEEMLVGLQGLPEYITFRDKEPTWKPDPNFAKDLLKLMIQTHINNDPAFPKRLEIRMVSKLVQATELTETEARQVLNALIVKKIKEAEDDDKEYDKVNKRGKNLATIKKLAALHKVVLPADKGGTVIRMGEEENEDKEKIFVLRMEYNLASPTKRKFGILDERLQKIRDLIRGVFKEGKIKEEADSALRIDSPERYRVFAKKLGEDNDLYNDLIKYKRYESDANKFIYRIEELAEEAIKTSQLEARVEVVAKIEFIKNETIDNVKYEELEGDLEIKGYSNLEKILLNSAKKISKISIEDCPNVKVIIVYDNQITEIKVPDDGLTNLQKLNFGNNKVEKIDVSKSVQLETLIFYGNPTGLQFVNGIKSLAKLVSLNTSETFPIITLLEKASEDDLKEVAEKLKLPAEGKSKDEIKKEIIAEIEKNNQNKEKLKDPENGIPELLNDKGEIDKDKLKNLKDDAEKGKKYQALLDEPTNEPIKNKDKNEIDQAKLTEKLKGAAEYEEFKSKNPNLITADGKIDQSKIDEFKKAGDEGEALKLAVKVYLGEKNWENELELKEFEAQIQNSMSNTAQNWLDTKYKDKNGSEELTGELEIKDYVNIQEIRLTRRDKKGKIEKVVIENCPQVEKIKLDNNEITEIVFKGNFPKLERLDLSNNGLKEIDVSLTPNLNGLNLNRNPDLERPTKEELAKAVNDKADEFKEYIKPSDLETKAREKGMVSKEEYEKVEKERDSRPNTTLDEYKKLQDNQEKHKPEDLEKHTAADLKPADYDNIKNKLDE
nr:2924_t:CDS:2 [Entrophospora candida]